MIIPKGQKAQTAIEVAVFGAILIFVLGTIVRSAANRGQHQHNTLKATRLALTLSYNTSASMQNSSRNNSSVLIVEDRLTAASAKYGAIDRVPLMMQGSGSHSANLFMPVDFGHSGDLPIMDVFVNGVHFTFTTSEFKKVGILADVPTGICAPTECVTRMRGNDTCGPCPVLQPNCVHRVEIGYCKNNQPLCDPPTPVCTDCTETSTETYTVDDSYQSCARLFSIVDNHPLILEWCDDGSGAAPKPCDVPVIPCSIGGNVPGCNLSADERFDLDRDGNPDVLQSERERFSWQWYLVMGYDEERGSATTYSAGSLSGIPGNSVTRTLELAEGINQESGKNVELDADEDLKVERVMGVHANSDGVIHTLDVNDAQEGDVDFTYDDSYATTLRPGFTRDVNLYTFVRETGQTVTGGTFLRLEEGKLFSVSASDNKQYIRTASKKDSVDVIERVFRLSNNTERFCTIGGTRVLWPGGPPNPNPVETCGIAIGDCFVSATISTTCMDLTGPNPLIYVRSRIQDLHGRKWVTDTSTDPYVDLLR